MISFRHVTELCNVEGKKKTKINLKIKELGNCTSAVLSYVY